MSYSAPVMAGLTMDTLNTLDTRVTTGCASDLKHTASSFAGGKPKKSTAKKPTKKSTTKKSTTKKSTTKATANKK